jgi:hypothetical protein
MQRGGKVKRRGGKIMRRGGKIMRRGGKVMQRGGKVMRRGGIYCGHRSGSLAYIAPIPDALSNCTLKKQL